jgi:hypothetical protein
MIAGRESPFSLYNEGLASFGDDGHYDHADAAGFIRLFSLPTRVEALQGAAIEEQSMKPRTASHTNGNGARAGVSA